jgi:hypothetical protein
VVSKLVGCSASAERAKIVATVVRVRTVARVASSVLAKIVARAAS